MNSIKKKKLKKWIGRVLLDVPVNLKKLVYYTFIVGLILLMFYPITQFLEKNVGGAFGTTTTNSEAISIIVIFVAIALINTTAIFLLNMIFIMKVNTNKEIAPVHYILWKEHLIVKFFFACIVLFVMCIVTYVSESLTKETLLTWILGINGLVLLNQFLLNMTKYEIADGELDIFKVCNIYTPLMKKNIFGWVIYVTLLMFFLYEGFARYTDIIDTTTGNEDMVALIVVLIIFSILFISIFNICKMIYFKFFLQKGVNKRLTKLDIKIDSLLKEEIIGELAII